MFLRCLPLRRNKPRAYISMHGDLWSSFHEKKVSIVIQKGNEHSAGSSLFSIVQRVISWMVPWRVGERETTLNPPIVRHTLSTRNHSLRYSRRLSLRWHSSRNSLWTFIHEKWKKKFLGLHRIPSFYSDYDIHSFIHWFIHLTLHLLKKKVDCVYQWIVSPSIIHGNKHGMLSKNVKSLQLFFYVWTQNLWYLCGRWFVKPAIKCDFTSSCYRLLSVGYWGGTTRRKSRCNKIQLQQNLFDSIFGSSGCCQVETVALHNIKKKT